MRGREEGVKRGGEGRRGEERRERARRCERGGGIYSMAVYRVLYCM